MRDTKVHRILTRNFGNAFRSQFLVSPRNGFLPRQEPLTKLPRTFKKLEELLNEMPYSKRDGSKGLLAKGQIKDATLEIPEYRHEVSKIDDPRILTGLFRDYTFWASAYLLEPCHLNMLKTGEYGLGRQVLPRNIAVPLSIVAKKLEMRPFMEYATSYALYNWQRRSRARRINYDNLELIREFTGMPSEHGFILVHVAMVAHSPKLVSSTLAILRSAKSEDRHSFDMGLGDFLMTMRSINLEMDTMWSRSDPKDYKEFRTFIMGIKDQPMFPNGVIYEGVSDTPVNYRGESGANDSIIPTADNLFQIYERMPDNPLTEILRDFRTYRPLTHNQWLQLVQRQSRDSKVQLFAMKSSHSSLLYLANLDQVREFRQRHWNFTKEYILKNSKHPVATGGSPIVTWLPNQLNTVLAMMKEVSRTINREMLDKDDMKWLLEIESRMESQDSILARDVQIFKSTIPGQ